MNNRDHYAQVACQSSQNLLSQVPGHKICAPGASVGSALGGSSEPVVQPDVEYQLARLNSELDELEVLESTLATRLTSILVPYVDGANETSKEPSASSPLGQRVQIARQRAAVVNGYLRNVIATLAI